MMSYTGNMPCSRKVVLKPGEHYVSAETAVVVSTLLGSCISACLYDPVRRIVGMNHFLLANHRYSRETPVCLSEAGRYGIHSMELIINGMMKLGAGRQRIPAKVFGGSSMLPVSGTSCNFACVGEVNCRFIVEFLKNDGIPLISSDLGGEPGQDHPFRCHGLFRLRQEDEGDCAKGRRSRTAILEQRDKSA